MKKTLNQQIIDSDILRYKKNKLAASLALLGLVFNCLYIMLLYGIKQANTADGARTRFVSLTIGFSVILTLIVLLATFLASEGVKGYNKKFSIILIVLAAFQIFRIFGFPLYGLRNGLLTVNYFWYNPDSSNYSVANSTPEFIIMVIYLCASAACLIASAVIGWVRAVQLEKFQKQLNAGEISVEKTLKAMDAEDEAVAQAQTATKAEEVQ